MTREPNKFQIQLADTNSLQLCRKCMLDITPMEDPEFVILWSAGKNNEAWTFHVVCFADVIEGMVQFFKTFIVEKKKLKKKPN